MSARKLITSLFLLAFTASMAYGQYLETVPGHLMNPWNNYVPSRINNNFQSIIGNGGTLVGSSNNAPAYGYDYAFNLPFDFYFIGTTYPSGYRLALSSVGYIGFNGTAQVSTSGYGATYAYYGYYYLYPFGSGNTYSYYNKMALAYCGDLQASGVTNGGIYTRVDGTAPNRTLIVEWRLQGSYYPSGNPGNFQAHLHERTGNIEYHYGPNSITRTSNVGYFGAWIGIKNQGETYYLTSSTPPLYNSSLRPAEQNRYLYFTRPSATDTVAFTSLPMINYNGTDTYYYIEYYTWTGYARHIHYDFPRLNGEQIGFRISPVLHDVATDSVWFTPSVTADAYGVNSTVTINARFKNIGGQARQNVPVQADVYLNGNNLVGSVTSTVFANPAQQFQTASITLGSVGPLSATGLYQVRVYPKLTSPEDQDFSNDTLYKNFYVTKPNDLMTYAILEPFSNVAPLFSKYPVGVSVPIEIRYLNIGTNTQFNATVGYQVLNSAGQIVTQGTTTVPGAWGPISFRDITYTGWVPNTPGRYYVRGITYLATDEQTNNDTMPAWPAIGKPFDVNYEIELAAGNPNGEPFSPVQNQHYPDGRPIDVFGTFTNSGVADATNVPARVQITDPSGTIVYDRSVTISDITGGNGSATQGFPAFTPNGPGRYCVKAWVNESRDPITTNDTASWCFTVADRLAGTIRVGFGERFATIQEAKDSLYRYGVSGPVTFELVNDAFTVETGEPTIPALDFRGDVVGLGANNPVTWKPVAGKTMVTVRLKSQSGIGMWYGQFNGRNPSGYITWDGGANKALTFIYENTNTDALSNAYNRSIPFFYSSGSSNYTLKNATIEPASGSERASALSLTLPTFNPQSLAFTFPNDLSLRTSAGVLLRNITPINEASGSNVDRWDTLRNQNNVLENLEIRNFGYGIASVGAGPLFVVGTGRFAEYNNQNNTYRNNLIENVTRAGVVVAFEQNSQIVGNTVRRVENTTVTPHAAGIWASAGTNNRGYSRDLIIDKNIVRDVNANVGTGAGVWVQTAENVLSTPNNVVQRYPLGLQSNMRVWNNSATSYRGVDASVGIGLTVASGSRSDLIIRGNRVENNSLYNQIAGTNAEYGILVEQNAGFVRNNIIAEVSQSAIPGMLPTGIALMGVADDDQLDVDYNIYWVPNGAIGVMSRISAEGYALPSPPVAMTLNQWRKLTGYDMHSVSGDITAEFVSVTPGSVDLHIRPNVVGSLANNRGVQVQGMTSDVDGDPRGASAVGGAYDIGFDEFTGTVRNYDLTAEDIMTPAGYRAPTGQFSDAEYVMTDPTVELMARIRNVGGMPNLANTVELVIERKNPQTGSYTQVSRQTVLTSADVASTRDLDFGTFAPQSLRQLNLNDPYYGMDPNVTPVYRIRLTTGRDDFAGNNSYEKEIRFYVQRSSRAILASVENYQSTAVDPITLSNKLNADTVVAAFADIFWDRADGSGAEDYDLFDRSKWPTENLDFSAWKTMVWSQGEEPEGLLPTERAAIERFMELGHQYEKRSLVIASQELAEIHDVALNGSNGNVADREFVRTYLRSQYVGATTPADYSNRKIRGLTITPGKYEELEPTGVAGDTPPMPSVLRATTGQGIATASHTYVDQTSFGGDSVAGVTAAGAKYNSVYYGFDWRHAGRFDFEVDRSGAQRLLLGALDFIDQFGGVLPIEWAYFNGFQVGRLSEVSLEMASETEVDVAQIVVERAEVMSSSTGEEIGSYSVVDRLAPKGSATEGARYEVRDRGVEYGRTYAYRLVTVDADGTRSIDKETRVEVSRAGSAAYELTVEPNPVMVSGTIRYRVADGDAARVSIYDATGRLVKELESRVGGEGTVAIDATDLTSGSYMVRLETTSGVVKTTKLVVQK